MMKPNDSAFPFVWTHTDGRTLGESGLTKREYLATMIYAAMQSIPDSTENRKVSAVVAVECADELLKALQEPRVEGTGEL